jgi:hypothetical protein
VLHLRKLRSRIINNFFLKKNSCSKRSKSGSFSLSEHPKKMRGGLSLIIGSNGEVIWKQNCLELFISGCDLYAISRHNPIGRTRESTPENCQRGITRIISVLVRATYSGVRTRQVYAHKYCILIFTAVFTAALLLLLILLMLLLMMLVLSCVCMHSAQWVFLLLLQEHGSYYGVDVDVAVAVTVSGLF